MNAVTPEALRREQIAIASIFESYGTEAGEYGATLFADHHIEEIESSYWLKQLGTETPDPKAVLGLLKLSSHWGDDGDELEFFDFVLPDNISNYVLSVQFDQSGSVIKVSMES